MNFPHPARAPRSVLVLDGDERAALAVVRSLVAAHYEVTVLAAQRWSLAGVSRGVRAYQRSHHPLTAPEAYVREVAALAQQLGAALVIPVTDASADAILSHRSLLPPEVRLPFAPLEVYRAASDKVHVHRLAKDAGIGIEASVIVERHGDPAPADTTLYPGYVKPHRSVVGGEERRKLGVSPIASREACTQVLAGLHPDAFPVIVQGKVVGPGEGVFVARWNGVTIARFAHRRLREKPPAGGVSVFRESIPLDPQVLAACERMLDALGWQGVAMIEGKRDLSTGAWYVMEINGRFWGSLQLAIDAGVDFPALLVGAVLGDDVGEPPTWKSGVRLRWEWGDVDHLLIRLRRSKQRLGLSEAAPGRIGAVLAFLTNRPGRDRLEVLRLRDPLPFVVESLGRLGLAR